MSISDEFDIIYNELFPDVFSYFNVCFGPQIAEDLSQEIFLKVWETVNSENKPSNWRAWTFRCAVNLKNDFFRRKYSDQKNEVITAEAVHNDDLQSIQIGQAFQRLTLEDRELLYLKSGGFDSEMIGEFFGISASAVRTRLQKAKQRFQNALETEGITV